LGSQLLDYQMRLAALNLEKIVEESNASTLFDSLIVQPLAERFPAPDRTLLIVIDALDEATSAGKNELARFLAAELDRLPEWLRRELAQGRLTLDRPEQFPQGLGGAYAQFFVRQFPDVTAYRQRLAPVLSVVVAAGGPLEAELVRSLFGWDDADQQELLGAL